MNKDTKVRDSRHTTNTYLAIMAALFFSYCLGGYHEKGKAYDNGYQEGYAAAIQVRR
jgi:hypothetical protein